MSSDSLNAGIETLVKQRDKALEQRDAARTVSRRFLEQRDAARTQLRELRNENGRLTEDRDRWRDAAGTLMDACETLTAAMKHYTETGHSLDGCGKNVETPNSHIPQWARS